ncbi:C4-dicarboxylate ABC transporter permease [Pseudooceanicola lipolyticus]|uniref:C4-dicarboxylate ABC transporter permease n=1 Tax=Pseudooceanicola lipolyticus TaxID=2029104 RepID=A0A2M8IYI9_9RHOB|nr:C4-dicarboxylate ABC transporter permease [Pseudooceanicola lipolyticus]PJE35593.1 C4-dicarboxylate ABC transporter permease [Pseudooceanicola lipolyticus]
MGDALIWFITNIGMGFYNIFYALTHLSLWLDWSDNEALMRFIYYGASIELFFALFDIFLVVTVIGLIVPRVMWGCTIALESLANFIGRAAAWVGLLMVLQQVMVVFLQSVFRLGNLTIAPLGFGFTQSVGWFSEELKLYNAIVVALCVTYTFVQGGHVRVDLVYAVVRFRTKKIIDMFGSIFFMVPAAVLTWLYAWFFLWRNLITPKVSASDSLELMLRKSKIVKWNVETIGFSPSGFNGYFLFKILMCTFTALVLLQAVAFFYRSLLEFREGEQSENKYLDKDTLGEGEEAYEGTH